jgi:hypothetical protein
LSHRHLIAAIPLAAALCAPAAAHAAVQPGVFPGEVIDGPTSALEKVGGVDLARDGGGAVVYVKQDGGVDHIFASRLSSGAWQPPERVDNGLSAAGSEPVVAASDGGRLAFAFLSGGSLYAVVRPAGAPSMPAPQLIGPASSNPSIDMSINGAAYITYTLNGDVRAARLDRTSTTFTEMGVVLDVDPSQPAGDTDARKSIVAVSADGTGIAVWGERGGDGRDHVYARRLFNASISTAPQDLTLSSYQGHTAGDASGPDVDIEDDSSFAWVTFLQVLDGQPRAIARRMVGSSFNDPALIDPLPFPTAEGVGSVAIDMNGTGGGLAASSSANSHQVYLAPLVDDAFGQGAPRADSAPANTVDADPLVGVAQSGAGFVTWLQSTGAGDPTAVHGRLYDVKTGLAPEVTMTNPALGAVDPSLGYAVSADRVNDGAVVAIQGTGADDRRLVAGMIDRPPASFVGTTTQKVRRLSHLNWSAAFDLWGPVTYSVQVDGKIIGQTQDTKYVPAQRIPDGLHRWRVIATDRRGQTSASATRILRIDNTPPRLVVRISGTRKAGKTLKFGFSAGDVVHPGASGLARIRVDWGDGSPPGLTGKRAAHAYRRGRFTLRVSATDKAGNATVVTRRLVIKKR